jgi:D-3-phosphoglycerate dehydrogenase
MAGNRRRVLVPDSMGAAGTDLLRARADIEMVQYDPRIAPADLRALLPDAAAIALSFTPFGAAEVAAATRIEAVARIGVGFDAVDVPALTARGVPLLTTGIANSTSVAESALTMMLTLAKRHVALDGLVRGGRWHERFANLPMEVTGKTVLVVGYGRIGSRTARKCAALDLRVLVHDPFVDAAAITRDGHTAAADLDAALPEADFVTIHCPKDAATTGLFDARRLRLMKRGAYLVNTARGGIVDEAALFAALTEGHLAGVGLDVFAAEPTPADNPLLTLPSVISAPHVAGVTVEAVAAMAAATARNILGALDGAIDAANVVNREVLR